MSDSSDDKELVRRVFNAFYAVDADALRESLSADFVWSQHAAWLRDGPGWMAGNGW